MDDRGPGRVGAEAARRAPRGPTPAHRSRGRAPVGRPARVPPAGGEGRVIAECEGTPGSMARGARPTASSLKPISVPGLRPAAAASATTRACSPPPSDDERRPGTVDPSRGTGIGGLRGGLDGRHAAMIRATRSPARPSAMAGPRAGSPAPERRVERAARARRRPRRDRPARG